MRGIRWSAACCVVVLSSVLAWSLNIAAQDTREAAHKEAQGITPNRAFKAGERLELIIGYEFIPAGRAVMKVEGIEEVSGRKAFYIRTETNSNRFFDPFFRVRDVIESYVDFDGLYSLKFSKRLREGRYKYDYEVEFDQERHTARSVSPAKRDTLEIPPHTQDILSALYYMRTLELEPGMTVKVTTLDNDKLYNLELNVIGRERVSTPAGTFDCLIVEPLLQGGGLFKYEGKLTVWVTDDHRKIPVLMKGKALIGSVIVKLDKVEGLVE